MSDPKTIEPNAQPNDDATDETKAPNTIPFFGGKNVTKPGLRAGVRAGRAEQARKS